MNLISESEAKRWIDGLAAFDKDNEVILLALFAAFGLPRSYLDVGSGDGAMVNTAEKLSVDVCGIDLLPRPNHPKLLQRDLRQQIDLRRTFELVTCIEVAEHLEEQYAETLIDTITRHAQGRIVFTAAMPGQPGDGHVNCVVEDTAIRASNIDAATRRAYHGQVVTIKTRRGNELTVTPNHPVLTPGGWIAANGLSEGDYVIRRRGAERVVATVMPNYDERPAAAEEIFRALAEMQEARRLSVPTSAEDFHGDGLDGEVQIVTPDRFPELRLDVAFLEPGRHLPIEVGYSQGELFDGLCAPGLRAPGVLLTAPGNKSLLGDRPAFSLGRLSIAPRVPFTDRAHRHAVAAQGTTDEGLGDADGFGNRSARLSSAVAVANGLNVERQSLRGADISDRDVRGNEDAPRSAVINMGECGQLTQRFSRLVALDEVVEIKRSDFRGHVYNLATGSGWYFANNIITHNCQPATYWRAKFAERKWSYSAGETYRLALMLATAQHASHHVEANLQVFVR